MRFKFIILLVFVIGVFSPIIGYSAGDCPVPSIGACIDDNNLCTSQPNQLYINISNYSIGSATSKGGCSNSCCYYTCNTGAIYSGGNCVCNLNYYKSGNSCTACSSGYTSPIGSNNQSDCTKSCTGEAITNCTTYSNPIVTEPNPCVCSQCDNGYFGSSCASSCGSCNLTTGNGTVGITTNTSNSCVYTINCNTGFHLDTSTNTCTTNGGGSATCVSNVQSCPITNGTGTKTWNGTSWGTCTVSSCNTNYHQGTGETCDPNIYNITLNDSNNGGSGGSGLIKEVYSTRWTNSGGSTITSVNTPTKLNNIFNGYFSSTSSGTLIIPNTGNLSSVLTTTFNDGNTTSLAATLYAQFSVCTPCNTPASSNANCSLNTTGNTCNYVTSCYTGYGDTTYGGVYTGANTNTPVCTANTYNVTLDDAGGSGGSGTIKAIYNTGWTSSGMPITSVSKPTKTGNIFTGYYTSASGGTQIIPATGDLPLNPTFFTSTTTLYAHWNTCSAGTGINGIIHVTSVSNSCAWYIDCYSGYENGHYDSNSATTTNSLLECTACSAGYYCDGTEGIQHKACPFGKTSIASSDSANDCFIKSGATGTNFCNGSNNCFYLPVDITY